MRRMAAVLVLAGGCAGYDPGDAWIGEYEGAVECVGEDLDGAPYEERSAQTMVIDRRRDDGRVFIASRACGIPLIVGDERIATIPRYECDTARPDGQPVHVIYESGGATLDGMALRVGWSGAVIYTGATRGRWAVYAGCVFEGWQAD